MSDKDGANAPTESTNVEADNDEMPASPEPANPRLLRESKEWKAKYFALKNEREEAEKKRLESQQEWKALAERLTNENKSLKDIYKTEKLRAAVHDRALRAGCINIEDLLKVGDQSLLQYDEEAQVWQGAEIFIEEARRLKPYLFQQKGASRSLTINSVTPGGVPEKKTSSAEIANMKPGDPRKLSAWIDAMKSKNTNN